MFAHINQAMARYSGSDEIFQLVHSLNADEKGYIKKLAKRYSEREGQLGKLFDVLYEQITYDENALKKQFNHLPVLKAQLFDLIIDALLLTGDDEDYEDGLWKKYKTINLLHRKGLTERALRINAKAIEMALRSEVFPVYERLLKQKFNIGRQQMPPEEYQKELKHLHKSLSEIYIASEQINQCYYCFGAMHLLEAKQKSGFTKATLLKQIPELNEILKKDFNSKFHIVNRNRLNALAKYHYLISESETAIKLLNELIEMERKLIDENHPAQRKENYYYTLNGLIYTYCSINKFDEALKVNEYARTLEFKSKDLEFERDVFFSYNKLILLFEIKNFKQGEQFATEAMNLINLKRGNARYPALASIVAFKIIFEWINGNFKQLFKTLSVADSIIYETGKQDFIKHLELVHLFVNLDAGNKGIAAREAKKLLNNENISFSKDESKLIAAIATCNKKEKTDCLDNMKMLLKNNKLSLKIFNIVQLTDLIKLRKTNT